jgi:hypothetical protein
MHSLADLTALRRKMLAEAAAAAPDLDDEPPPDDAYDCDGPPDEPPPPKSEPKSKPDPRALQLLDVDAIFAPLPSVPWLVLGLDMCPGAPTLLAGYGFSGKTLAAQSLALSVATGRPTWGYYETRRGRVVHIDLEQGARLTSERYQRLARGMGIHPDELRGQLAVAALPTLRLTDPRAKEQLLRVCDGAALLIIDSLRAGAPDIEENSSQFRGCLDMLTSVSEKTGATPKLLHHARKPTQDGSGGAKATIRGSSAIFDACASVLVMSAEKGEPALITHEKARTSGITAEDFALRIEDVASGADPRWGLRVSTVGSEAVKDTREAKKAARKRAAVDTVSDRVVRFVLEHPGCSQNAILQGVDGNNPDKRSAIELLVSNGRVRREEHPSGNGKAHTVVS